MKRFMKSVNWPKPDYAISNIPYNLIFTTKFNESLIYDYFMWQFEFIVGGWRRWIRLKYSNQIKLLVIILIGYGNYGIYCCQKEENMYSLPCGIYGELLYYENVSLMLVSFLGSIHI